MRGRAGFTLLEVLLAFFVMSTTLTALIVFVNQNVAALARAQQRAEARSLAEEHARAILQSADLPELGVEEGDFDEPHAHLRWQLVVEPYTVPVPEGRQEAARRSTVFAEPGTIPDAPQPSVRRAVVRVFPAEGDPAEAEPYVVFSVDSTAPPAAAEHLVGGRGAADRFDSGQSDGRDTRDRGPRGSLGPRAGQRADDGRQGHDDPRHDERDRVRSRYRQRLRRRRQPGRRLEAP